MMTSVNRQPDVLRQRLFQLINNTKSNVRLRYNYSKSISKGFGNPKAAISHSMAAPESKTLQNLNGNWTLNEEFSGDYSEALKFQGVNVMIRTAAASASVHLKVSQPDDKHISMKQTATAVKIPGTAEEYTLDWEWRESKDPVFGDLVGRSRWISVTDAQKEGGSGDWIDGDSDSMLIQAEAKKPDDAWGGIHFWGFENVGGARRHTRRIKIWRNDGEEIHMRMVYDFDGE